MTVRQLEKPPGLGGLYGRAAITARGRHGDSLPDVSYALRDVEIQRDNLASYDQVCGFRQSDQLPPTYPHILGFPLGVQLMVDPDFPFALPGLVHVNNRISQQRPLRADERMTLCVHATNLRDHPRGRQFDMLTDVTIDGEPVWNEVSTYLRRQNSPSPARGSSKNPSPTASKNQSAPKTPSPGPGEGRGGGTPANALWRIPRDIGRRYASVSGDVNPIHLNPLAARLFGFPRSIAHGMWLKARCLAALEGRLPDRLEVEVEFKSPLLLPSTVAFNASPDNGTWSMAVTQARTGRPHLNGRVTEGAS